MEGGGVLFVGESSSSFTPDDLGPSTSSAVLPGEVEESAGSSSTSASASAAAAGGGSVVLGSRFSKSSTEREGILDERKRKLLEMHRKYVV